MKRLLIACGLLVCSGVAMADTPTIIALPCKDVNGGKLHHTVHAEYVDETHIMIQYQNAGITLPLLEHTNDFALYKGIAPDGSNGYLSVGFGQMKAEVYLEGIHFHARCSSHS